MSIERDGLYLNLIAEAIEDIRRRIGECEIGVFITDRDEHALTAFRLSIIGENANKLSNELKAQYPDLPWPDMVAFRNIVSHEYHRVDPILAWEAAHALDAIEEMVDAELARLNK
jgi:uncharacterized protein with HEPN domain